MDKPILIALALVLLTGSTIYFSGHEEISEADYRWIAEAMTEDHGLMARPMATAMQDGYVSVYELSALRSRFKAERANALKSRIRAAAMK